jgi:DNA-binding protein HU-beta
MINIVLFIVMIMSTQKKINRTEFIDELADKLGSSKAHAEKFLNEFIDLVTQKLTADYHVNLTGFGQYRVTNRRARTGVNPKTGQKMSIGSSKSVRFKPGKTLKELIRTK